MENRQLTPEFQIIDIHQDMIVSLNEEVDSLHDALGILRAEIEELKAAIADRDDEIEALRWHIANRDQELDWLNNEVKRLTKGFDDAGMVRGPTIEQ